MNATNLIEFSEKTKFSGIRDLGRFPAEFQEAAEPLNQVLENRLRRIEKASAKSLPYLLEEIQLLSDGLTNLEALFGSLFEMYCDLGDACLFLDAQWRGTSDIMQILKEALHKTKVEAWEQRKLIDQLQKHGV